MSSEVFSDRSLAIRLESAEARANARFVEARALLGNGSGACSASIAGAHALFDGPRSPCTQTFGLGLSRLPAEAEMDELEAFFTSRGAPVFHEVSPLCDDALPHLLGRRGYRPVEFTAVLYLPLSEAAILPLEESGSMQVRVADRDRPQLWTRTAALGWREQSEMGVPIAEMMRMVALQEGNVLFLVDFAGLPIATGVLAVSDKVALFAGASTVAEWRRRGAQNALLRNRLEYALEAGCDLAMFCAAPGSSSQRNAERNGFRTAYTRIKFALNA